MIERPTPTPKIVVSLALLVLFAGTVSAGQSGASAVRLYHEAQHSEEVEGDAERAVELYEKVLDAPGAGPRLAATAEYRLATLLTRMGRVAEARAHHERIVSRYSDDPELREIVSASRGALGTARPFGDSPTLVARRLWDGPPASSRSSPSLDGEFLAYVDRSTGDPAFLELASGETRRLTREGALSDLRKYACSIVTSPDGEAAAYTWFTDTADHEVRLVGTDGTPSLLLRDDQFTGHLELKAWSADGDHLLGLLYDKAGGKEMVRIAVDGGELEVLETFDWRAPEMLNLSPDGRYVAYDLPSEADPTDRDIFILDTLTDRKTAVVRHPANDLFPVWTPDGARLLFASDRTGSLGVWTVEMVDGEPRGRPRLVKADLGRSIPLAVTRDGSLIYSVQTGIRDVYTADFDPNSGALLSDPESASLRFVRANGSADWSPNGRRLVYVSERGAVPAGLGSKVLIVRALDSDDERELSPDLYDFFHPRWTPDGDGILVLGTDRKNRWGLYRIEVSTGELAALTLWESENCACELPAAASPDGRSILFVRKDHNGRVAVFELDTERGEESPIFAVPKPRSILAMELGPEARLLALEIYGEKGEARLVVMDRHTGSTRTIHATDTEEYPRLVGWAPDGRGLLMVLGASGERRLLRIPLDGSEPRQLALELDDDDRELRIHPAGDRIVFTSGHHSSELWILENLMTGG